MDMQAETAMSAAFSDAGFKPLSDRLSDLAIKAWAAFPSEKHAFLRLQHIKRSLRGELTFCLVDQFIPRGLNDAIDALLRDAAEKIAAQRPKNPAEAGAGASQRDVETRVGAAAPANIFRSTNGQFSSPGAAPKATAAPPAPTKKELADRHAAAMASKISVSVALSKLDTFILNECPIGDLTPAEAHAWCASRERDVRFIRLVTQGVPENGIIRNFVTPDEANEAYRRAELVP